MGRLMTVKIHTVPWFIAHDFFAQRNMQFDGSVFGCLYRYQCLKLHSLIPSNTFCSCNYYVYLQCKYLLHDLFQVISLSHFSNLCMFIACLWPFAVFRMHKFLSLGERKKRPVLLEARNNDSIEPLFFNSEYLFFKESEIKFQKQIFKIDEKENIVQFQSIPKIV